MENGRVTDQVIQSVFQVMDQQLLLELNITMEMVLIVVM